MVFEMKNHSSAALLRNYEILMYMSKLRSQNLLRLAYGQFFIQTQNFRSALNNCFSTTKNCGSMLFSTILAQ